MKKNIYVFTTAFLIIQSVSAIAQITVSQNQFESVFVIGDSLNALYSNDTTLDVGQTGGPNIYDLRPLHFIGMKAAVENGSSIPIVAPHFPNDTVLAVPGNNNVVSFSGSRMLGIGHVNIISDTSYKVNVKIPGEVIFDFPLTYNKSWSYSYTSYDTTYDNGTAVSGTAGGDNRKTIVDGFGTIILPNGDSLACLRLFQGPASGSINTGDSAYTFFFITQNGIFVDVEAPGNSAATGKIPIYSVQVIQGSSPTSVETGKNEPLSISLSQNYPNPFNPTTAISYQLSAFSHVTLKVYDVLGREVATLVNKEQQAGKYSVQLSADSYQLASGVYFYKLTAGSFSQIKKLMLLK